MYIPIIHLCLFLCRVNKRHKNIDKGKFLKELVEKSGVSVISLMKKVGYKHRASYYAHIAKPDLSLEILQKYAQALKIDLRSEFPDSLEFLIEDNSPTNYSSPESLPEAMEAIKYWREKFYSLLEKYTKLIERESRQ